MTEKLKKNMNKAENKTLKVSYTRDIARTELGKSIDHE